MTMDSEDDFDHLNTSQASDPRKPTVSPKHGNTADKSSSEDEVSIKAESDTEQEMPAAPEHSFIDVSIKSEQESEIDDDSDDGEKQALISRFVQELKSRMNYTDDSDVSEESSDEKDEISIKSEQEDDVSIKSEPDTEYQSQEPEPVLHEDNERALDVSLTEKGQNNSKKEKKDVKKRKAQKELEMEPPRSKEEEELMSLVFGGKETPGPHEKQQKKVEASGTAPEAQKKGTKSKSNGKKRKVPKEIKIDQPRSDMEKELMSLVFGGKETPGPQEKQQKKVEASGTAPEAQKKGTKSKSNRKKRKVPKEFKIDQPRSDMEKKLMSLVFGGTATLVSELANDRKEEGQEKKTSTKTSKERKPDDKTNGKRAAIWHDSDDDDEEDSANIKRNKFSREELPEQLTNDRRRKQFEQIVGKPKWADLDRVQEPDSDDEILQTVGHVVKGAASQGLPKGMIELKKLKNLNRETKAEGEITGINFHPTSMVAIITGKRGLVSIVAVDGVRNEKLHTIWLRKMRVVCSRLSPDGNEVIFGSYRKFYHVYNLISGQSDTLKIPERETWLMKNFCVSRCGKYLASAGECGEVHLMSAKSKEMLQTIQLRYPCQSLAFTPDSRHLLCHSNDMEVSVFSLVQKRIVNVFLDDGCVNGSCIAICPNGQFVATGSRQGVVNIYPLDVTLTQKQPVPLKTVNNLTTYIDTLSFNVTSELLAIASSTVKNAIKLIHVKSATVFRNFPLPMTNMGHVTKAEFSPSGGYLALGTKESTVLLFRVKHYPNY